MSIKIDNYPFHRHFLSTYFIPTTILCNEASVKINNKNFYPHGAYEQRVAQGQSKISELRSEFRLSWF